MKLAIIYWSGTGNTAQMAQLVAQGAGNGAEIKPVGDATVDDVTGADAIALGCSAMGDEVLEESEFEPFMESIQDKLAGKKLGLFGSYDWGDGQWMRDWEQRVQDAGAQLVSDGVIVCGYPDGDGAEACQALGQALAN